ncbi:MAG TPA: segregation/condensation protein A, partial [Micavibrio sp.]
GSGIYARGMPEGLKIQTNITWDFNLYDLLKAYGDIRRRQDGSAYEMPTFAIMSLSDALDRLGKMLGGLPRKGPYSMWVSLVSLLPERIKDKLFGRSSVASMFTAGLELAKQGKVELKQDGPFRPIYLRANYIERNDLPRGDEAANDIAGETVEQAALQNEE